LIKNLDWESKFFKISCAEISDYEQLVSNRTIKEYDWVQGKALVGDRKRISFYEDLGFKFEDLRLSLHKTNLIKTTEQYHTYNIRKAEINDNKSISDIAEAELIESSRFIALVGTVKTKYFYRKWVENAIVGIYDDFCYVIENEAKITGFITLKKNQNKLEIRLLAIEKKFHSRGFGKSLISFAENLALTLQCNSLSVISAGKNMKATQFYINSGYNIEKIESWYYLKSVPASKYMN